MPDSPVPPAPGPIPGPAGRAAKAGREAVPGPSALPSVGARAIAFVAIVVAGLCGLLIGRALVDVQCTDSCGTASGIGAVVGAVMAAGGVAVVAVLALRAMSEWRARS